MAESITFKFYDYNIELFLNNWITLDMTPLNISFLCLTDKLKWIEFLFFESA